MVKFVTKLFGIFAGWTLLFVVFKLVFVGFYASAMGTSAGDAWQTVCHGLPMDMTVAGYVSIIPFLLTIASVWTSRRWVDIAANVWFAAMAVVLGLIYSLDIGLYGVWGFRIDMTPVFYFCSSPTAAMASMTAIQWIGGAMGMLLFAALIWSVMYLLIWKCIKLDTRKSILKSIAGVLLLGVLFIPIRGGVTVSTMNPGYVYFSSVPHLNQAALNPAFNLLYSATHQGNFSKQFRYMTDEEVSELLQRYEAEPRDTVAYSKVKTPDVWLIILESFSSHLMPSLGGDSIAVRLDSVARRGVSFANCYASSFRTDRALPAVLSGFPAQPTTSLMKFVDKTARVPSVARTLRDAGYTTTYYYGGDVNFTNMNAFLVNAGYDRIVSDKDFPLGMRLSKWGVYDHNLFERAMKEVDEGADKPRFRVIQTSSSHEPFEVPYSNPKFKEKPRRNAFAYTDMWLGNFLENLKRTGQWQNTLVFITADHQGAWPEQLEPGAKQHIPFVITGGALSGAPQRVDGIMSQTDIAASILDMLSMPTSDFGFSRSAITKAPKYAFFSQPGQAGVVTPQGVYTLDTTTGKPTSPNTPAEMTKLIQAYLQKLYSTIDKM